MTEIADYAWLTGLEAAVVLDDLAQGDASAMLLLTRQGVREIAILAERCEYNRVDLG